MLLINKNNNKIIDKKREIIDRIIYNKDGEKMAQKKGLFIALYYYIDFKLKTG